MERYSGKNVKVAVVGLDNNDDILEDDIRYFRGTANVKIEDRNILVDDTLDAQQYPTLYSVIEDRKRGTFDLKSMAFKDNSFSILVNNFFNNPATEGGTLYAGKTLGLNEVAPDIGILADDISDPKFYQGFVNEIEISANADDKFVFMSAKGEIRDYDDVEQGDFDWGIVSRPSGNPYKVTDMTITDKGDSVQLSNIKDMNVVLKNGAAIIETIGDTARGSFAFEGEGKITVISDDETNPRLKNYLENVQTTTFDAELSATDGTNTMIIRLYNVKLGGFSPDYDRSKAQLETEFNFYLVRAIGTHNVEITL